MFKYISKRVLQMIPVLIVISIIIFALAEAMPGDALSMYLGEDHTMSPEQIELLRERLGLNGNVVQRYFSWILNIFRADFGQSVANHKPVSEVIGTYIGNTFLLNIVTTVIAFILSIFIGIHSAMRRGKLFDNFWSVFTMIFVSIPTFVFGLLLIYIFPVKLGWLYIGGMRTAGAVFPNSFLKIWDIAKHMILPSVVLISVQLAEFVRYIRSSMLDVIGQDYIRTARAKGLSERVVIYKHAFRNALIPVVTLIGSSIASMFTGAMMLEKVYSWPGMGTLLIESINLRDQPVMITLFLLYAVMTLVGNLISDIGYAIVDPQVKLK